MFLSSSARSLLRHLRLLSKPATIAATQNGDHPGHYQLNRTSLQSRLYDTFQRVFDLGFTAFGGPPVHFQIFHKRFVEGSNAKAPWIDEQTYQELFALSQALPGPASTKMLFNIAYIHVGPLPAMLAFLLWSFPGAIAMYSLSLVVQKIGETLPNPVYALLSGINAATVGVIALAAIQLSRKAITDPLTRLLVLFGGCSGLCYNALWYFPALLAVSGLVALAWDMIGQTWMRRWRIRRMRRQAHPSGEQPEHATELGDLPMGSQTDSQGAARRQTETISNVEPGHDEEAQRAAPPSGDSRTLRINTPEHSNIPEHSVSLKIGVGITLAFFTIFAVFVTLRGTLHSPPLLLRLFNNMILAGTIIFGGGPVVIPLLRDYVVAPGWVSPRDFLLGLAVIQALPGPNFNFAVYLGALVLSGPHSDKSTPTAIGAFVAFLGIFSPGLLLSIGFQSLWKTLRKRRAVLSILRGVNAAAVGFVFTAVYRLWEIGYLTADKNVGISLGQEPWWLVIAAVTLTFVEWFSTPPPIAILSGGLLGVGWWYVVGRHSHNH